MPLPEYVVSDPNQKTPMWFSTFSPALEEWGPTILEYVTDYFTKLGYLRLVGFPIVKYEISDDKGLPHFHIADGYLDRHKLHKFIKEFARWANRTFDKHLTKHGDMSKGFSFRVFKVPHRQTINSNVLRGKALIDHYLTSPTKVKSTEGANYTLELTDWSVTTYLADEKARLDEMPDDDYCKPLAIDTYDRHKKYASKFARKFAHNPRAKLDHWLLENDVPFTRMADPTWQAKKWPVSPPR